MINQASAPRPSSGRGFFFHFKAASILSALYVWSYYLTEALVAPLQAKLHPELVMSLLFFPHGVRVLAAWLYGWRSVAFLLPGALLCNLHFAGEAAFHPSSLLAVTTSLVAAPLAFTLTRKLFPNLSTVPGKTNLWTITLVGFLASVFNLSALQAVHAHAPMEGAVILVGDMSGLLFSLALVRLAVTLIERRR
jgi:hypothetical protein